MRVLVDLNVILDVLLDRAPHADEAAALWAAIEVGHAEGFLAAHAVTTLHYLAGRGQSRVFAERCVRDLLTVFAVAPVDRDVIDDALRLGGPDFEDAVTIAAGARAGCTLIATRDRAGFKRSPVTCLDPAAALAAIRSR